MENEINCESTAISFDLHFALKRMEKQKLLMYNVAVLYFHRIFMLDV